MTPNAAGAIQPHRRTSSTGRSVSASVARRKLGAATAGPSVTTCARQSSKRSRRPDRRGRRRELVDGVPERRCNTTGANIPGHARRAQDAEVRLARETEIEWLQTLRRLEQQRRSIAAEAGRERDVGAQQVDPGKLRSSGERPRPSPTAAGRRQRRRPGSSPAPRPAPAPPAARVLRQRDGSLQERGRGGEATARLGSASRLLERNGDRLVRSGRGCRQMPRSTVRVGVPVGRLRQGQVNRATILPDAEPYTAERTSGWRNDTARRFSGDPARRRRRRPGA